VHKHLQRGGLEQEPRVVDLRQGVQEPALVLHTLHRFRSLMALLSGFQTVELSGVLAYAPQFAGTSSVYRHVKGDTLNTHFFGVLLLLWELTHLGLYTWLPCDA